MWTIEVEPARASDGFWQLAMEVDPRRRRVSLGWRVVGGGSLDVQSGAIARSFFEVADPDCAAAAAWLRQPEAQALLEEVGAGYHCETLWTGDPVARWSEEAWAAGNQIYRRVEALLSR